VSAIQAGLADNGLRRADVHQHLGAGSARLSVQLSVASEPLIPKAAAWTKAFCSVWMPRPTSMRSASGIPRFSRRQPTSEQQARPRAAPLRTLTHQPALL
jgi:hypothetical protein